MKLTIEQRLAQAELDQKLIVQAGDSARLLNMINGQQTTIDTLNGQLAQITQDNAMLRNLINAQATTTSAMQVQISEIHAMLKGLGTQKAPAKEKEEASSSTKNQKETKRTATRSPRRDNTNDEGSESDKSEFKQVGRSRTRRSHNDVRTNDEL